MSKRKVKIKNNKINKNIFIVLGIIIAIVLIFVASNYNFSKNITGYDVSTPCDSSKEDCDDITDIDITCDAEETPVLGLYNSLPTANLGDRRCVSGDGGIRAVFECTRQYPQDGGWALVQECSEDSPSTQATNERQNCYNQEEYGRLYGKCERPKTCFTDTCIPPGTNAPQARYLYSCELDSYNEIKITSEDCSELGSIGQTTITTGFCKQNYQGASSCTTKTQPIEQRPAS